MNIAIALVVSVSLINFVWSSDNVLIPTSNNGSLLTSGAASADIGNFSASNSCVIQSAKHTSTAGANNDTNAEVEHNRSTSWSDENKPVYEMHPLYNKRPLTQEALYKTLIYANAYAAYVWRGKRGADLGVFTPPNPYGIQIMVTQIPRKAMLINFMPWLLLEIGERLRRDNHYTSLTATITCRGEPFAILSLTSTGPSPATRSLLSAAIRRTIDGHDGLHLDSMPRKASDPGDHVHVRDIGRQLKRGLSPHSFDRKLTTSIEIRPGFVVKDAENILMLTMLTLAKSAFEHPQASSFKIRSPCSDIEVDAKPGVAQGSVQGNEILDSLIDAVEWLYAQHARTGIFFMMHMLVFDKSIGQVEHDPSQSIAVIDTFVPDP